MWGGGLGRGPARSRSASPAPGSSAGRDPEQRTEQEGFLDWGWWGGVAGGVEGLGLSLSLFLAAPREGGSVVTGGQTRVPVHLEILPHTRIKEA